MQKYNDLKVSSDTKSNVRRKIKSLFAATKEVWGSNYIETQKERLDELKKDLLVHLALNNRWIK